MEKTSFTPLEENPESNIQIIEQTPSDNKVKYFDMLRSTGEIVHKKVNEYISQTEHMNESNRLKTLFEKMMILPEARKEKGVMRSLLTQLVFDCCGGSKELDISSALASSEINNINAYLDNILLDNKKRVLNANHSEMVEKITSITITSGIFREIFEKTICDLPCSEEHKLRILKATSSAMTKSYIGQELDIELTIDKLDNIGNDQEYLSQYIRKSKLQSGYLYGLSAEIGAILANANEDSIDLAREIGETIGLGLHINNDFGDFAPLTKGSTGFKVYQDQFADLRNGRLSLPIFHVLRHGSEQQKNLFNKISSGQQCTEEEFNEAALAILDSGAYDLCKKISRRYENKAKTLIHKLPESESRDLLSTMSSIIRSNKFLVELKKAKNG